MEKIREIKISVNNISKDFMIGRGANMRTLERLVSLFSGKEQKRLIHVLKDLSFNVYSGEILGIIGDNGSGKSTLLRIIAGIYHPNSGNIIINGKIISLINLTAGLKDRLTMKENIFLIGSLFGMAQKEIKRQFNDIVEFSGLKEFLNTKIYQFSEGMKQRMAFSVAIHCHPDILLLDEVFEVGDQDFKEKSSNKIKEIVKNRGCVVLVSHDMQMINKYCQRIIKIEKGRIKESKPVKL